MTTQRRITNRGRERPCDNCDPSFGCFGDPYRECVKGPDDAQAWTSGVDTPLPEDAAIAAAHPTRTGRHDLYAEAMRLVGARRSKGGLVALVNWLLCEAACVYCRKSPAVPVCAACYWAHEEQRT